MKAKYLILIAITFMFAFGCTDEKSENYLVTRSYYATVEDKESETKLYLENNLLYWNTDDRISVFEGKTSNSQFKFDGTHGDRSGSFTCVSGTPSGEDIAANYAYYPYDAATSISSSGVLSVTIPGTQYNFPGHKNAMVAVTTSVSDHTLNFKNVCGYLKLNIEGEASYKIRTITLTGNSGEIISGPATITASASSAPTIEMSSSGESTITLDLDTPGVSLMGSDPVSFYIMVPPTVFSSGFKVRVTDTEGRWMEKSTTTKTIERNTILNMPAFTFENPYTSISAIRAMYSGPGSTTTMSSSVKIKGSVISNFGKSTIDGLWNFISPKIMVVSDGESGIMLYLSEENTQFRRGDEVSIDLSNQVLTDYNKIIEISNLPITNITKIGTAPLKPIPVTFSELERYECMYVSLPDVQIAESDIGRYFVEYNSNNNKVQTSINFVTSSSDSFILFSGSSFIDGTTTLVPSGSGPLNGIYMTYKGTTKQMVITSHDDYAGLIGERFDSMPDWVIPDRVNGWMELPNVTMNTDRAYISHYCPDDLSVRNFSMLYDRQYKLALWVAYPISSYYIGDSGRTENAWAYDPKIPQMYQPNLGKSYAASNLDRGHQMPSADRTRSVSQNKTTFYYSNMTAQNSRLNQVIWGNLEDKVRGYLTGYDTLYVITGPVMKTADYPTVSYTKDKDSSLVAVPNAYFKVLLRYKKSTETYSAIGFWYENREYSYNNPVSSDAHTVSWIENKTGYTFFPNLPEPTRTTVINTLTYSAWGL